MTSSSIHFSWVLSCDRGRGDDSLPPFKSHSSVGAAPSLSLQACEEYLLSSSVQRGGADVPCVFGDVPHLSPSPAVFSSPTSSGSGA